MKTLPIKVNDQWDLMVPEHRAKQWDVRWEPDRLGSMFKNTRVGDVVLDVGSENADMTALYSQWIGPTGGIIMVEAVANYWPWARLTFEANKLPVPLRSFVGFASDHKSDGDPRDVGNFGPHTYIDSWPPATDTGIWIEEPGFQSIVENTALPHLPLWEIVREQHIDVLTMDCEGAEYEILKGAEPILARDKPLIYVSVHEEFMPRDYGHSVEELHTYAKSLGYEYKILARVHETHEIWWHPEGRQPV